MQIISMVNIFAAFVSAYLGKEQLEQFKKTLNGTNRTAPLIVRRKKNCFIECATVKIELRRSKFFGKDRTAPPNMLRNK